MADTDMKLCINCKFSSISHTRDPELAKCFAPQNIKGINPVDGSYVFISSYCANQRRGEFNTSCGISGTWFVKREEPPVTMGMKVKIDKNTNLLDLL